jgi:hypothetical protein
MIRNEHRAFFTRLPVGRVGFRWSSKQIASRSGAGAARKRQYQGTGAFESRRGFFAAGAQVERKCYQFPLAENDIAFLRRPFT